MMVAYGRLGMSKRFRGNAIHTLGMVSKGLICI
jgi:hypothetical protein